MRQLLSRLWPKKKSSAYEAEGWDLLDRTDKCVEDIYAGMEKTLAELKKIGASFDGANTSREEASAFIEQIVHLANNNEAVSVMRKLPGLMREQSDFNKRTQAELLPAKLHSTFITANFKMFELQKDYYAFEDKWNQAIDAIHLAKDAADTLRLAKVAQASTVGTYGPLPAARKIVIGKNKGAV